MNKEFDLWNENKKILDIKEFKNIKCDRGEIWICKIGENIGNEISKDNPFIRPILIINSFLNGDLILMFPLTTKYSKTYSQFLFKIDKEIGLRYDSYIMLNQIRAISKRRLIRRVATITDTNLFNNIIFDFEKKY